MGEAGHCQERIPHQAENETLMYLTRQEFIINEQTKIMSIILCSYSVCVYSDIYCSTEDLSFLIGIEQFATVIIAINI